MKKLLFSSVLIVGFTTITYTQEPSLQLQTKPLTVSSEVTVVEHYNQAISQKEQELNASKRSTRSVYMGLKKELDALLLEYMEVLKVEIERASTAEDKKLYQAELIVIQQKTAN